MTDASLRYEIEQLKRKLLQTQEERDRAMSNCHELWKRLNSLISLAASTTASYTLSSSGLPTSPSDSYDSRSKSTSPNSSSAASLNDSLLSTSNGTTTSNNSTHLNNNNNNTSHHNNNNPSTNSASSKLMSNGNSVSLNQPQSQHQSHHTPLNLKSVNAIKSNNSSNNNSVYHTSSLHQINGTASNNNNNNSSSPNATNNNNLSNHNHLNNNNNQNHHTPLNLKSVNAIKDINNNHPLIAEVQRLGKETVGEIEEIAPGQFKCRYCDKTFDRIFSVHRHERVHTGFKPCVCKACGRGFSEKRNLRHHIIRFHSDGSGRELLKRNRNKSAAAAAAAAASASAAQQQQQSHHQASAKQQIKQLSAAASFLNSTSTNNGPSQNGAGLNSGTNGSIISNNINSTTSSQITATISRLQNISKNEPIDTSGLNVLGAAAAVITVSSSSSRRRKSKPSKKINHGFIL